MRNPGNRPGNFKVVLRLSTHLLLLYGINAWPTTTTKMQCQSNSQDGSAIISAQLEEDRVYKLLPNDDKTNRFSHICRWQFFLKRYDKAVVLVEIEPETKVTLGDAIPNVTYIVQRNGSVVRTFRWKAIRSFFIFLNRTESLEVRLDNLSDQSLYPWLGFNLKLITANACPGGCLFGDSCYILRPVESLCGNSSLEDCRLLDQYAAQLESGSAKGNLFLNSCHSTPEFREAQGNTVLLAIDTNVNTSHPVAKADGKLLTIRVNESGGQLDFEPVGKDGSGQLSITPDIADNRTDTSTIEKSAQRKTVIIILPIIAIVLMVSIGIGILFAWRHNQNRNATGKEQHKMHSGNGAAEQQDLIAQVAAANGRH